MSTGVSRWSVVGLETPQGMSPFVPLCPRSRETFFLALQGPSSPKLAAILLGAETARRRKLLYDSRDVIRYHRKRSRSSKPICHNASPKPTIEAPMPATIFSSNKSGPISVCLRWEKWLIGRGGLACEEPTQEDPEDSVSIALEEDATGALLYTLVRSAVSDHITSEPAMEPTGKRTLHKDTVRGVQRVIEWISISFASYIPSPSSLPRNICRG